nr:DNA translocase FtsK [Rubricella aquisinus]
MKETARKAILRGVGVALMLVGAALAAMLLTHDPRDPSFFNAVSASPRNALGLAGAYGSDLMLRLLGWAAWGLVLALVVWGGRMAFLRGASRVLSIGLVPVAVILGAGFAALHVPPITWLGDVGLGGIIGDEAIIRLLPLWPLQTAMGVNLLTLAIGVLTVMVGLISLGVDRMEFAAGMRRFWRGLRTALRGGVIILALLWAGVRIVIGAILHSMMRQRADRSTPDEDVIDTRMEPRFDADMPADPTEAEEEERGRSRLMARLTGALAREAEPVKAVAEPPLSADLRDPEPEPRPAPRTVVQHPHPKKAAKSKRAMAEEQPKLFADNDDGYDAPPLSLLEAPLDIRRPAASDEALSQNAKLLESVLDEYGIGGTIEAVKPGPVVTMYELEPAPGLKASRVIGLADDIARSMSALAARVSTVPGRNVIGIELPNDLREKVHFREILSARAYGDSAHRLPLALGKDIGGEPVVANLARMPHLLIAGTTGSGKSVAINTMILSLLYKLGPEECRMIMIDPKMLELSVYDGIPHLLSPVVTDPKKAVVALKWVVAEMEERYRKMSKMGVRNIDGYNGRVAEALKNGEAFTRTVQTGFDEDTGEPIFETQEFEPEKMPFIVVVVDEMADLMMVAGKEIEACIQRLAQMARASGIHLIMATQRPSVDVITGTIKANFPTRISFQVTSKIDSRTILGEQGAEQLLGQGDMLYMAGGGRITRVHGPFVSDEEVEEIVNHLKSLGVPEYVNGVTEGPDEEKSADIDAVLGLGGNTGGEDALYDQAVQIVARDRKCSTSYIQRKLAIGYNKAARLVEQMEENGVVSPSNKVGKRDILVPEVQ